MTHSDFCVYVAHGHYARSVEGPSSRLFDKTSPHTPQMATFDSSILAAGRLDQRKETKTSRLGLRLHRSCDAAGCRLVFVSLRWSSLPAAKVDESKIAICGVCGDVLLKSLELGPSSIVTVCNVQTEV